MEFLSVRDLRTRPAVIWKKLAKENEMVVTNHGKPMALLLSIDSENFESSLRALRQLAARRAVLDLQQKAEEDGFDDVSLPEAILEVKRVRNLKKK